LFKTGGVESLVVARVRGLRCGLYHGSRAGAKGKRIADSHTDTANQGTAALPQKESWWCFISKCIRVQRPGNPTLFIGEEDQLVPRNRLGLRVTVTFASLICVFSLPASTAIQAGGTLALVGAKVYTSPIEPPIPNGVVLVRDGEIVAVGRRNDVKVPKGATILDCTGRYLLAGFQNSHVHFTEPKWVDAAHVPAAQLAQQFAEMLTRYGFTTVVDTASFTQNTTALRARVEAGEVAGPRIITAGSALYPKDGIPFYLRDAMSADELKLLLTPATPDDAVRDVRQNMDHGADILKLFTSSWIGRGKTQPMDQQVATAAAAEAHRRGNLVFAHPSNISGLDVALAAHVDILAHAIEDTRGLKDSYFVQMKAAGMSMIPTLILFRKDPYLWEILSQVGWYSREGGQILFGTDVGFLTDYDPTEEYLLMSRAGLTPMQILASLTTAPAARFGEAARRGRIAPGMDADLVVLNTDVADNPRAFSDVHATIRKGAVVFSTPPKH
jgi:imidazolonepropionase-like amidohydrolase